MESEYRNELLEITPLGSGSEVGRSCILLKFCERTILLDCGIHPAYNGLGSLPYFDEIDIESIDLLLITHFHLDHCGSLPYLLEKTNFKGECYMTHPTKAIYKLLLSDYVKVAHVSPEESVYDEADLIRSLDKIKLIDYNQEFSYKDIKFTAFNAGHVLGAAMFLVEIQGIRVLYTGDYSREEDRHLKPAEPPKIDVHFLIVESTYGIHIHEPRSEREKIFTKAVSDIVRNDGKVLLPVFALGRAQELLLILEEYWKENKDLQKVQIYYASSLATKCMDIFKSYTNMMGPIINKRLYEGKNPFNFDYIESVKNIDNYNFSKPVVVMSSPGMLQSGLSRNLFDKWCEDPKNGVIITGYCVEGTLARHLLNEPAEIKLNDGRIVQRKIEVKSVTFCAHSDFSQTSDFIAKLKPKYVILVHGDKKEMERLKNKLDETNKLTLSNIYNPKNCQKVEFILKTKRTSYVVGKTLLKNYNFAKWEKMLAASDDEIELEEDNMVEVEQLVFLENENLLVGVDEIEQFSNLRNNQFKQMLQIDFSQCKNTALSAILSFYQNVKINDEGLVVINDKVYLYFLKKTIVLEWFSVPKVDLLADSIALLIYQIEQQPTSEIFSHYADETSCSHRNELIVKFLSTKWPDTVVKEDKIIINENFVIDLKSLVVQGSGPDKEDLEKTLEYYRNVLA